MSGFSGDSDDQRAILGWLYEALLTLIALAPYVALFRWVGVL